MKIEGSYIQYAEGFNKDEITSVDIDKALTDLYNMDDEHSAFWVGVYDSDASEVVLELNKELKLILGFAGDYNHKIQLKSTEESKEYFSLLLDGQISELKERLKNN